MSTAAVRAAVAAKEELLGFNDRHFDAWYQGQKSGGSEIGTRFGTEFAELGLRGLIQQCVPPAELFVIEPVMSAVVKMAAEDLPAEATFLPDDLPTQSGMLYFADPLPLPGHRRSMPPLNWTRSSGRRSPAGSWSSAGRERSPRRAMRSVCP
jgi:hypothetical protein